jgi:hypothetical protein
MPEYTRLLREFGNASGVVHRTRFLCVILLIAEKHFYGDHGLTRAGTAPPTPLPPPSPLPADLRSDIEMPMTSETADLNHPKVVQVEVVQVAGASAAPPSRSARQRIAAFEARVNAYPTALARASAERRHRQSA